MSVIKAHHPIKHIKSFKYAFSGIWHALLNEANFRVQIVYTIIMVMLGFYFQISPAEWSVLILASASLLSAEVINTSIENFIDFIFPEKSPAIKVVKDLSAGYVFINAISFLLISIIIFIKYISF
jgi:diacylglycerol kinase